MDVPQSCKNEQNKLSTYNDKVAVFEQLLEKDISLSIHTRNLRFVTVGMFKVVECRH